jgi:hypothetical protein
MAGDVENAECHCEQRTESNQYPSTSVEGYVEGVKWFEPARLQVREYECVLEKRFERKYRGAPFRPFTKLL